MLVMKCLRALSVPLAAEHGESGDIFLTAPEEILTIPIGACKEETNPACQCRRIFVGLSSAQPTTLARVSMCKGSEIRQIVDNSSKVMGEEEAARRSASGSGLVSLHDPKAIAYAIRHFDVGAFVRVQRTADSIMIEDIWKASSVPAPER